MTVLVRPATEADIKGVLALYAQPEIDDGSVLDREAATAIFRRFASYPSYRLFVAEQDGAIVGTFALLIMDNLGHLGAPSAIIEDVAVAPQLQGQGIGKAMMERALAEAGRAGAYKATLSSAAKRRAAHAFYDAIGFERHGYSFRVDLAGGGA